MMYKSYDSRFMRSFVLSIDNMILQSTELQTAFFTDSLTLSCSLPAKHAHPTQKNQDFRHLTYVTTLSSRCLYPSPPKEIFSFHHHLSLSHKKQHNVRGTYYPFPNQTNPTQTLYLYIYIPVYPNLLLWFGRSIVRKRKTKEGSKITIGIR